MGVVKQHSSTTLGYLAFCDSFQQVIDGWEEKLVLVGREREGGRLKRVKYRASE